jgi:pyruvate dehydrogenase E1 component
MPDFWQFPTVSMGLGPIRRSTRRASTATCTTAASPTRRPQGVGFLGDGEMDEPESLGAISLAGARGLDNLIFVVNCNLQRLDGPVRGNGKIIQELEAVFRGAGWNVIKVIWGATGTAARARHDGLLLKVMDETSTASTRTTRPSDGAYIREHFFGKYPELRRAGRAPVRRRHRRSTAAATIRARSTPPTQAASKHQGPADGDPGQDRQGLRHGRGARARTSPTSRRS